MVLLFERVWPALWPAIGVAGLFIALALLGLPRVLSPGVHLAYTVTFVAAFLALLIRGIARIRLPRDAEADRRLETASGVQHRPLAVPVRQAECTR